MEPIVCGIVFLLFHAFACFSLANKYADEPETTFGIVSVFYFVLTHF